MNRHKIQKATISLEVEEQLKDFDFEKEYARQSAERKKELNDPANAEFFKQIRKKHEEETHRFAIKQQRERINKRNHARYKGCV